MPHAPQLNASACRSVQKPPQQLLRAAQGAPHAPQFTASVVRSTHWPEQSVGVGTEQVGALLHTPETHAPPAPQTFPHQPQLLASRSRSTQPLPQQAGATTLAPPQAVPQAPQFKGSVV